MRRLAVTGATVFPIGRAVISALVALLAAARIGDVIAAERTPLAARGTAVVSGIAVRGTVIAFFTAGDDTIAATRLADGTRRAEAR